jgi:phage terminase large subunit-like protein
MDLSTTTDLTSVVLAFPLEDQSFALLPKFWIPEDNLHRLMDRDKVPYDAWVRDGYVATTPGPVINYNYVREYIRNCAEQFELKEIAYDRWNATQLVTDLDDDGFTLIPFGQGFMSMSPAAKSFEELLLQNRIMHGSDPVLSWNAGNVSVRTDPAGNIKPDKDKSTARIDGIIASIMALDRAVRNSNAGSVYEERGLRTI